MASIMDPRQLVAPWKEHLDVAVSAWTASLDNPELKTLMDLAQTLEFPSTGDFAAKVGPRLGMQLRRDSSDAHPVPAITAVFEKSINGSVHRLNKTLRALAISQACLDFAAGKSDNPDFKEQARTLHKEVTSAIRKMAEKFVDLIVAQIDRLPKNDPSRSKKPNEIKEEYEHVAATPLEEDDNFKTYASQKLRTLQPKVLLRVLSFSASTNARRPKDVAHPEIVEILIKNVYPRSTLTTKRERQFLTNRESKTRVDREIDRRINDLAGVFTREPLDQQSFTKCIETANDVTTKIPIYQGMSSDIKTAIANAHGVLSFFSDDNRVLARHPRTTAVFQWVILSMMVHSWHTVFFKTRADMSEDGPEFDSLVKHLRRTTTAKLAKHTNDYVGRAYGIKEMLDKLWAPPLHLAAVYYMYGVWAAKNVFGVSNAVASELAFMLGLVAHAKDELDEGEKKHNQHGVVKLATKFIRGENEREKTIAFFAYRASVLLWPKRLSALPNIPKRAKAVSSDDGVVTKLRWVAIDLFTTRPTTNQENRDHALFGVNFARLATANIVKYAAWWLNVTVISALIRQLGVTNAKATRTLLDRDQNWLIATHKKTGTLSKLFKDVLGNASSTIGAKSYLPNVDLSEIYSEVKQSEDAVGMVSLKAVLPKPPDAASQSMGQEQPQLRDGPGAPPRRHQRRSETSGGGSSFLSWVASFVSPGTRSETVPTPTARHRRSGLFSPPQIKIEDMLKSSGKGFELLSDVRRRLQFQDEEGGENEEIAVITEATPSESFAAQWGSVVKYSKTRRRSASASAASQAGDGSEDLSALLLRRHNLFVHPKSLDRIVGGSNNQCSWVSDEAIMTACSIFAAQQWEETDGNPSAIVVPFSVDLFSQFMGTSYEHAKDSAETLWRLMRVEEKRVIAIVNDGKGHWVVFDFPPNFDATTFEGAELYDSLTAEGKEADVDLMQIVWSFTGVKTGVKTGDDDEPTLPSPETKRYLSTPQTDITACGPIALATAFRLAKTERGKVEDSLRLDIWALRRWFMRGLADFHFEEVPVIRMDDVVAVEAAEYRHGSGSTLNSEHDAKDGDGDYGEQEEKTLREKIRRRVELEKLLPEVKEALGWEEESEGKRREEQIKLKVGEDRAEFRDRVIKERKAVRSKAEELLRKQDEKEKLGALKDVAYNQQDILAKQRNGRADGRGTENDPITFDS